MPLKSKIAVFRAGLPASIDLGVEQTADELKVERDRLVPIDTGDLLESGFVARIAPGYWEFSEGSGLPDARASFTEYGTGTQAAQPHVTPAAERTRPNLEKNVGAQIKALEGKSRI